MLIYSGATFTTTQTLNPQINFTKTLISPPIQSPTQQLLKFTRSKCGAFAGIGALAAAVVLSTPAPAEETLSNIPQNLAGNSCEFSNSSDCEEMKVKRIQKPKSRNAERCTSKCVTTCTRGGEGSPGEGPLNLRGPIVVFKQGFRSRQYCLVECSDICNLLDDADKVKGR
ncbi:hypothetical protein vseg_020660 [Gypsophila vaccaria]